MNDKIKTFTDLIAWREGHKLVLEIYKITETFPNKETFGLISQMRRCAISITSNIAEGFSRQSDKEKIQFYKISLGSLSELQNQLLISRDVGFINNIIFQKIAEQTIMPKKLILGMVKKLKNT